jgi:hypothetical protein
VVRLRAYALRRDNFRLNAARKLVEAAGVEPASENPSSSATTCVSPFSMSQLVGNGAKSPSRHLRRISSSHVGAARDNQPAEWRSSQSRRPSLGDRSLTVKQRERSQNSQLANFPPVLRGDGPRHASHDPEPPSKPSRPRECRTERFSIVPSCCDARRLIVEGLAWPFSESTSSVLHLAIGSAGRPVPLACARRWRITSAMGRHAIAAGSAATAHQIPNHRRHPATSVRRSARLGLAGS